MYDQESEYPIVSDAFGKVDGFALSRSHETHLPFTRYRYDPIVTLSDYHD